MKILLIQSPVGDIDSRIPVEHGLFPWGLATVARFLEDDGHEIQVHDIFARWLSRADVTAYLDRTSFDAVGIHGFASVNYLYVVWLAEEIKKRYSVPVVVGGLLSDHHHNLLLTKNTIDVCVIGEGELTAQELFRYLDQPAKWSAVKGIAYRQNGAIRVNEPRPNIENLDSLPMPNFDLWDMDVYTRVMMYIHDSSTMYDAYDGHYKGSPEDLFPNMTFLAGRGCPFKCNFCSRSYDFIRPKSIGRIIDEIKYMQERYHIKAAHFSDELLIVNRKRIFEFCAAIKKLDIYWDGQGRVSTLNRETMFALRDAKCLSVGIGVESGSNKMLQAMKKGITREQSLRVLREARDVGLHLKIQLMGGYPGETKATLAETASLIKEAGMPPRRLTWTTPLPGSELYEQAKRDGLIPDEESYVIKLHRGYNTVQFVILNMSGNSDAEMSRLFNWVHLQMYFNYLGTLFRQQGKRFRRVFWWHLGVTLRAALRYYVPFLYGFVFAAYQRIVPRLPRKAQRWIQRWL